MSVRPQPFGDLLMRWIGRTQTVKPEVFGLECFGEPSFLIRQVGLDHSPKKRQSTSGGRKSPARSMSMPIGTPLNPVLASTQAV